MKLAKTKNKLKISLIVALSSLLSLAVALPVIFGYIAFGATSPKTFNDSSNTAVANREEAPTTPASLTFFDVGHGDCSLIQYKNKTILVDTGKPEDRIAQRLLKKGVSKIDYLIITHPHGDHIGGLEEIQKRLEVGTIIQDKPFHGEFFIVIKPPQEYENENDNSLVVSLLINGKMVLIPGDNDFESQKDLCGMFKLDKKQIYLLKYPHHGVDDFPLYLYLKPEITVISCGTDGVKYNIPQNVIQEQEENGSKVYWTARDGDININLP